MEIKDGLKSPHVNEDISSSPSPSKSQITQPAASKLNFFDLIIEIRLKIYQELLVVAKPISFNTSFGTGYSGHFDADAKESVGPSLQLLRVNKQIYLEATPILYLNNTFELSHVEESLTPTIIRNETPVQFLTQIGNRNASFIRHLGIYFPWFKTCKEGKIRLEREILELIAAKCTDLITIKMLLWDNYRTDYLKHQKSLQHEYVEIENISAELLNLVDTELKKISSLTEIIVDDHIWKEWQRPEINDKLTKMMLDCGWKVQVAKEEFSDNSDSDSICCGLGAYTLFD
ncbi:hypothetical protein OCU04_012531 [Sclerotinia nivalis]|uniref:DUF7730 domain-containing protein n=1 Tax=Sclerotinia nivalis TaxID=352851 RepID=A0A9X0DD16_9HELO|nr:hypothetical protein OCU04_012531 [Sclerotinia nivalis]